MTLLTDDAKKAIAEIRPSLVATVNGNGKPNVSAKGSLRVLDDEHIVFADIASPRTVVNIRENPEVAAELAGRILKWQEETPLFDGSLEANKRMSPETIKRLQSLGYLGN